MPNADRPLAGEPLPHTWHPRLYLAELVGTGLMVSAGVSVVILMFGQGGRASLLLPDEGVRRLVTGFLFGLVGAFVTVSPVGRVSGAHINPAVSLAFYAEGKLAARDTVGYILAQLTGGLLCIGPLGAWGAFGRSVQFGATVPRAGAPTWIALLGEIAVTYALVTLIFVMGSHRRMRAFTPWSIAPLFSIMVWLEAPLSGTSANPARSLAPAILSGTVSDLWIYFVGPALGALLAVGVLRLEIAGAHHPPLARVGHFTVDAASPPDGAGARTAPEGRQRGHPRNERPS